MLNVFDFIRLVFIIFFLLHFCGDHKINVAFVCMRLTDIGLLWTTGIGEGERETRQIICGG